DLIARVKSLLHLSPASPSAEEMSASVPESGRPSNALAGLFSSGAAPASSMPGMAPRAANSAPVATAAPRPAAPAPMAPRPAAPAGADIQKLRNEILRLELLVKKLQAELEAEHQYCAALEAHFKNLQGS
ncbi:MAG: hypothetical protein WA434_09655, partial [Candidatus Acidiferrales bacterium]